MTELGYTKEELKFFERLAEFSMDRNNNETISFFKNEANLSFLRNFLNSRSGEKILTELREKGLFYTLAWHFDDKNVQKILRVLHPRLLKCLYFCKSRGNKSGDSGHPYPL